MPEFELSSGWLVTAIVVYGVAALICFGVRSAIYPKRYWDARCRGYFRRKRTRRQSLIATTGGILAALLFAGIANFLTFFTSSNGETGYLDRVSALNKFGFTPDMTYPIDVGSRFGATEITGSRFTIRSVSTSILSVAFHSRKDTYILELPVKDLKFERRPGAPTMKLRVNNDTYGYVYGQVVTTANGQCRLVIDSGLAACRYGSFTTEKILSQGTIDSGLPALLDQGLLNGVIGLPEEMFNEVLGKTG